MNVAVKFYKDVPNKPKHIPDHWPAEVVENCDTPPEDYWVVMTLDEYNEYRVQNFVETKKAPADLAGRRGFWSKFRSFLGFK